jgi:formate hydrogenlyase transcriptional activator
VTFESDESGQSRSAFGRLNERLLRQLNMGRRFEDLFDSVYEQLRGMVPYNRIAVALLERGGQLLRLTSCRSDGETALKVGYAAHVEGSTLATLLQTGQPRIIDDLPAYLADKPRSASTGLIVREGMRSSLTLPLLADGKPIGVIFFSSRERETYTRSHIDLLRPLAGHIAISIEKTQLIHQLQQRQAELLEANRAKDEFLGVLKNEVENQTKQLRLSEQRHRLLVELSRIVNSSLDVRQIFGGAAEEIHKLLDCDRVSLLLKHFHGTSRHGFAVEFRDGRGQWVDVPALPLPGSAFDWVMQQRRPRAARLLADSPQFPEDRQLFELGYRCMVYLPLFSRDLGVGVLGIMSRQPKEPDQWNLELLREVGDQLSIALDNATAYAEIHRLKGDLEAQNVYLRSEIRSAQDVGNLIGECGPMRQVKAAIEQVALANSTVLILGETGTGKELIARAIHEASQRREHLMVKVNCAALSPSLIGSELFGHEAGAFTGAVERRVGRFELAEGGSIFLDEISEIPPETQVMLLRVLQERTIERVGGSDPIAIDTRIIAASNRDLKTLVDSGKFREDLYYRLNVFPIHVPPLRDRREDIPALLNCFIERFRQRLNKPVTGVDRHTMELLMNYHWPGNVRELENIVERAMIISRDQTLSIDPSWLTSTPIVKASSVATEPSLRDLERQIILERLSNCGGKIYGPGGAAHSLGLKPTTLYGKMRKLQIKPRHRE